MSRLGRLLATLREFYGPLPEPPHDPFTLVVWDVLSVHSTPHKRDAALAALRRARALTPDAMTRVPAKTLTDGVALAGPYLDQRLRALQTASDVFRRSPSLPAAIKGPIVSAARALKPLPQMTEGGAHRMLLFAGEHAVMPVDASVSRVGRRLGYGAARPSAAGTARSVRAALTKELPHDRRTYQMAATYLDHHGSATCTESDPHCHVCPLNGDCAEGLRRLARSH